MMTLSLNTSVNWLDIGEWQPLDLCETVGREAQLMQPLIRSLKGKGLSSSLPNIGEVFVQACWEEDEESLYWNIPDSTSLQIERLALTSRRPGRWCENF